MNAKFKILASACVAGALLMGSQAFALTCPTGTQGTYVCISTSSSETTLQDLFNAWITSGTVPNVYTNQASPSSLWDISASSGSVNRILIELAGNATFNSYGIFDPTNPSNTLQLFSGADSAGALTTLSVSYDGLTYSNGITSTTFGVANLFGYYLNTPNGTFYSLPSLNGTNSVYPGGIPNMVAYQGSNQYLNVPGVTQGTWDPSEYIMAWEDLPYAQSDLDYNDFIVIAESIHPVPEPAVLGMFGLGLIIILSAVGLRRRGYKKP